MSYKAKSHRTIPDLMSASFPCNDYSQNRSTLLKGACGANPRTHLNPLVSQGSHNTRMNRYTPYSTFNYTGPSQKPAIRNLSGLSQRQNTHLDLLSYSEVLKETPNVMKPKEEEGVTLQISNIDPTIEEHNIRHYLLGQLKSITPVISLSMETPTIAKVKVLSNECAKQVITHLQRKKVGQKRILVSYLNEPSSATTSALKCQVTGLLKDIPNNTLLVYKFRELFQSRFKKPISILDLYRMQDICTISHDKNNERFITLNPDYANAVKNNLLVNSSQHSVPYCLYHFTKEQDKGWAELEIKPLPNVMLSISQIESIIYELLKTHKDDVPIASIMYCIEAELKIKLENVFNGVPLECLISCVRGVQITNNSFGIKVLNWIEHEQLACDASETSSLHSTTSNYRFGARGNSVDPLGQISREVVELVKMSPKSVMKFNRFIPAYHKHFGKQCRVADYGYTRLIDLLNALSSTILVIGDGENRCITLTHRTQIRRFTVDLLKILRGHPCKSIYLSHLAEMFTLSHNHPFDITEYGVCNIEDMLNGLVENNSVMIEPANNGTDVLISLVKRQQTPIEIERTANFAYEVVELLRNAPQYSILFKKFVRSYHYHFGYQCRLNTYGFSKLTELFEAISGSIKLENEADDENRKINLCQKIALRVFSEQMQELIKNFTGKVTSLVKLNEVLQWHKNKYGYQMHSQTLGYANMSEACQHMPFIEVFEKDNEDYIISHLEDTHFRQRAYAAAIVIDETGSDKMVLKSFIQIYASRFNEILTEKGIYDMRHSVEIIVINGVKMVCLTPLMKLILRVSALLQFETYLNICEIKTALKLPLSYCFEMGYPNISSLIQAHMDLFTSSNENFIHERSDIRLRQDCILTKKGLYKFTNQCKQYSGRNPLSDNFKPKFPSCVGNGLTQSQKHGKPDQIQRTNTPRTTFFPDNQRYSEVGFLKSTNTAYEKQNHENFKKDNNNNWPSQSSTSYQPNPIGGPSHFKVQQSRGGSNLSTMFGFGSCQKGGNDSFPSFNFSSYYEPPKPDTPPRRLGPFTFDPVWSDNIYGVYEPGSSNNMHSLNIHIPELTTVNIMPVAASPCNHSNRARTPATANVNNVNDKNNNITKSS